MSTEATVKSLYEVLYSLVHGPTAPHGTLPGTTRTHGTHGTTRHYTHARHYTHTHRRYGATVKLVVTKLTTTSTASAILTRYIACKITYD